MGARVSLIEACKKFQNLFFLYSKMFLNIMRFKLADLLPENAF